MSVRGELSLGQFDRARRETIRYHKEFYAAAALGQAGTWLARPHGLMLDALTLIPADRPVITYDLGAGVGRHAIPMLRQLPSGSTVVAVDLLQPALRTLEQAAPQGLATRLRTQTADLNDFEFDAPADLVLAFSAIEHLPDLASVRRLLDRIAKALRPGGVAAIGIVADRYEIDHDGSHRPALLESSITADQAHAVLTDAFIDFSVVYERVNPTEVHEQRGSETYTLVSTLITWLGTKRSLASIHR